MPASSDRDFLSGFSSAQRRLLFAGMLVFVYAGALVVTGGLSTPPYRDEIHFASTSKLFATPLPPTLEQLRGYPEVITPLAFVVWGQLERATGDVSTAGRWLNLALSILILLLVAYRSGRQETQPILAACGILLCPYFIPLSVTLYTDVFATFIALVGLRLHIRGHPWAGAAVLALAIATRQYMVVVPTALAAWECWRTLGGEARWREALAATLAAGTLLGWFAFFGGLAPAPGLAVWLPPYPAPMADAFNFLFAYGLYFLACIGVYFVAIELVLFRRAIRWSALASGRSLAIAVGLLALFAAFPPIYEDRVQGGLERTLLWLLPELLADAGRLSLYFGLAWLACLRFAYRLDLAFWLVAVNTVLMLKVQLSWDKYALPVVVMLWFLKSERLLADGPFPCQDDPVDTPSRQTQTA